MEQIQSRCSDKIEIKSLGPILVGQLRKSQEMQPLNSAIGLLSLAFCPIVDSLRASFVGVWCKKAFIPTWFSG